MFTEQGIQKFVSKSDFFHPDSFYTRKGYLCGYETRTERYFRDSPHNGRGTFSYAEEQTILSK
jgi:hypothetical protein